MTEYQYDQASRLLSVKQPNGETVSYTYDGRGNRASMTYPNGKTVSYTYDSMDRMVSVKGVDGVTTKYTYDALGRRTATTGGKVDTKYAYDEVGNLVSQTSTGAYDLALSYAYDKSGRMTGESRTEQGATLESSYVYDALGQLTAFTRSDGLSESYAYDAVGNMTAKTVGGVKTAMTYNAANQLVRSVSAGETTRYSYDANGNLLKAENAAGARSYAYNALGLLASFTGEDGYTESYTYNANRLLSGITNQNGTSSLTYDILYGEGVVIGESRNGKTTSYTYGLERISAITGSTRTEYVYDGRGSVAAEVSYNKAWYTLGGGLAKKNITSKSYTPFGEQLGDAATGFGYNGEYYNAATGMVYLRARFYEPELNRFSQKDLLRGKVVTPGSLNRYLYVQNDPVNFVDPSGMFSLKGAWNAVKSTVKTAVKTAVTAVTTAVKTVAAAVTPGRTQAKSAGATAANLRGGVSGSPARTQTGTTGTSQAGQYSHVNLWPDQSYSQYPAITRPTIENIFRSMFKCTEEDRARRKAAVERQAEINRRAEESIAKAEQTQKQMLDKQADYNQRSLAKAIGGDYVSGNHTALSIGLQAVAGFFNVDILMDIRDLSYDISHRHELDNAAGRIAADIAFMLPVVGMLKPVKHLDDVAGVAKHLDDVSDLAIKNIDDISGAGKGIGKTVPNPYGKKGSPDHQKVINSILPSKPENMITKEFRFVTPDGVKGYRYADAVEVTPDNTIVAIYQVGRVNQSGLVVTRESTAIADILQVSDGVPVTFLPYNSDIGPIIFD